MRFNQLAIVSFSLTLLAAQTAYAGPYEDGVKLYGQRNFKAAAAKFELAVKSSPSNINAYYYRGLSYQYMGNIPKARSSYQVLIDRFPASPAAQYANQALAAPTPAYQASQTTAGARTKTTTSPSDQEGGEQSRVYFTKKGNELMVDAEVNNRRISVVFDTGAEACVFGKNHLQQLGINPPSGQATGKSSGVGSSASVDTWTMNADIKVGQIVRRNFPISVQAEMLTDPLLGQSFFKDFEYTIDYGSNSILLAKKGSSQSVQAGYAVPFVREGSEMVVTVDVDGKSCPMYFDTGAEGITFSKDQVKALGMSIPDDAAQESSVGVGGVTTGVGFNVKRMRLGPVDKSDIHISVVNESKMPKPLLGQNFYSGWQYTIDNQHNMIKFVRR